MTTKAKLRRIDEGVQRERSVEMALMLSKPVREVYESHSRIHGIETLADFFHAQATGERVDEHFSEKLLDELLAWSNKESLLDMIYNEYLKIEGCSLDNYLDIWIVLGQIFY